MLARFGNWFIGRGFKTDAEYWRDQDKAIKQGSSQVVSGKPTQHAAGSTQVKKRKLKLCKKCGYTKSHPVHIRLCLGIIISSPGLVAQFRTILNPRVRNAWTVQQGD